MAPAFDVFLDRLMLLQVIVFVWGGVVTHIRVTLTHQLCLGRVGLWSLLKSVSSLFLQESGKKPKIISPISCLCVYLAQKIDELVKID